MTPPSTGPRTLPAPQVTALNPIAMPRSCDGKTSVIIAIAFAESIAPPRPCNTREAISIVSLTARPQATEPIVKMMKPRLYMRTRPNISAMRPKVSSSTVLTSR